MPPFNLDKSPLSRHNSVNSSIFSFRPRRHTVTVPEAKPQELRRGFRAYEEEIIPGNVGKEQIIQTELTSVIPGVSACDERFLLLSGLQPGIYVVVFINPYSGGQMGMELLKLRFQHFRLRENNRVQIQWYNMFDDEDRDRGVEYLRWILTAKETVNSLLRNAGRRSIDIYYIDNARLTSHNPRAKSGSMVFFDDLNVAKLPPEDRDFIYQYAHKTTVAPFEVHVWSAGGDGTVMSVYDMLVSENISFSSIYFSCIPFGTGNDMSQALGWGRTVKKNLVSANLSNLISLTESRLTGDLALLDVWEVEIKTFPGGYVKEIHKNDKDSTKRQTYRRRFCSLFSMGVQGLVGKEFEPRRTKSRIRNILQYTAQSAKWVTLRKFPVITEILESIEQNGRIVMKTAMPKLYDDLSPEVRARAALPDTDANGVPIPVLDIHPIEIIAQNIPHIWGRDHDLWGQAKSLPIMSQRNGPTDQNNWTPQNSGDGKLEVFIIESVKSYIRKQMTTKDSLGRIGQLQEDFTMRFRNPEVYQSFHNNSSHTNRRHKATPPGFTCLMIDGEFYELFQPQTIEIRRHSCIRAIGSGEQNSRLVRDTQNYCQTLHTPSMTPTPNSPNPTPTLGSGRGIDTSAGPAVMVPLEGEQTVVNSNNDPGGPSPSGMGGGDVDAGTSGLLHPSSQLPNERNVMVHHEPVQVEVSTINNSYFAKVDFKIPSKSFSDAKSTNVIEPNRHISPALEPESPSPTPQ
ncbi:ATP-NAD kinase-like domain-containing protein [Dimargaris cristalligena]|uniref:ATP-NAD kinase-like domain-containing protein n=1 Tax=Dimargaris cristalligena TaxID=215637 RepID=A0A4Q0A2J2_9FUNG|nr:ATP-NAD kinase-like domain-containing protein [Dimargaris cristalligena]|eukprot:RKP39741.1 ATP-NAD kinase-like domain-containing protein [Dimargaris cristalligena]